MAVLVRLAVGATFAGDYAVLAVLSESDARAVYAVEQQSTGRRMVLKVFPGEIAADAAARTTYLEELRRSARVASDYVTAVRAAGIDETTGMPWLAMEHLTGADLAAAIEKHDGPWPLPVWDEVLTQVCRGLSAVCAAGLCAGSLAPDSVYLAVPLRAGAAFHVELLDVAMPRAAQALENAVPGRRPWLAPEVAAGAVPTPASDVWALGLLAFYLLTGKSYWREAAAGGDGLAREVSEGATEAATARARALRVTTEFPDGFDAWFAACVVIDPKKRFSDARRAFDAADFLHDADAVDEKEVIFDRLTAKASSLPGAPASTRAQRVPPPLPPVVRAIAANPRPAIGAIVALIALALFGGVKVGEWLSVGARTKAVKWAKGELGACERACKAGDAIACHGLGLMYRGGLKVARNDARAAEYFRMACNGGDASGCGELSAQYLSGEGVAEDRPQAAVLLQRACDGGDGVSCMDLADRYDQGNGVTTDHARARALQQSACKTGLREACGAGREGAPP